MPLDFVKMCSGRNSPSSSPSPSVAESSSGSDSSGRSTPRYTPDEIAIIFLNFYKFLTNLDYDAVDLKIPPPGGWPTMTTEICAPLITGYALEVARRLPYFDEKSKADIHYKSRLIDYPSYERDDFHKYDRREDIEFWSSEGVVGPIYIVCIAGGRESFGRDLFLNVIDGEITESLIRAMDLSPVDIKDYFDNLREAYQTLKLIPCPGRITIEAWDVEDGADEITEEQVISQKKEWHTNLDVQYALDSIINMRAFAAALVFNATVAVASVFDTILPTEEPTITSDPWRCTTEIFESYFDVPKPTGSLLTAILFYGDKLQKGCKSALTDAMGLPVCTFPP
ncbi:hypothetical protein B0T10DRAFT_603878 [Thelonectria olida]|uniref:DUF7735 domain-containing protein n=1 Tax=Thelonectria olida TaxID=1576542 RepID=A0A9P9ASE4_9HYPO|nr:hypothetical protein B0T10DRAFT_603878 [Thelonectria olida]